MNLTAIKNFRKATQEDAKSILWLYQETLDQKNTHPSFVDSLFLDWKELKKKILASDHLWFVGESTQKEILLCFSLLFDAKQRLAKIERLLFSPKIENPIAVLEMALPIFLEKMQDQIDLLYSTTRSISLEEQQLSIALGFELLGIFPNAIGQDKTKINGFTSFYFENVILQKRDCRFRLHPIVAPLFEIVRRNMNLPEQGIIKEIPSFPHSSHSFPKLECIQAPGFVRHRFEALLEKNLLPVQFYPFQIPNLMILDPSQTIEIFVRWIPELRFAALVSERIDCLIDLKQLYREVSQILAGFGVNCIEVLCDAGEYLGIEAFIQSGFLPCAYIPAFKKQGDIRRDYVALLQIFEKVRPIPHTTREFLHPNYLDFFRCYCELDAKGRLSEE